MYFGSSISKARSFIETSNLCFSVLVFSKNFTYKFAVVPSFPFELKVNGLPKCVEVSLRQRGVKGVTVIFPSILIET